MVTLNTGHAANQSAPATTKSKLAFQGIDIAPKEATNVQKFIDFKKTRTIQDPIHGQISFDDPIMWLIIDTPQFKRLQNLKQLGVCYQVFPSATHKRFEHSIGTGYLAQTQMRLLQKNQEYLGITERDVRNVTIAGLCHDLGHGPFSHLFDNEFIKQLFIEEGNLNEKWSHEDASVMIFSDILDKNSYLRQQITQSDEQFIKELIHGVKQEDREWIGEIISNSRNGIDVDKFDYLRRDTQKSNMNYCSFNHDKVMMTARVIEGKIAYPEKEIQEIKKLFDTRYNMYMQCYNHRVTHAFECLLLDILFEAKGICNFTQAIRDPEIYQTLDDTILHEIRISDEPEYEKARQLLERYDSRKHYSFVAEKVINKTTDFKVTAEGVCKYSEMGLEPHDICVRQFSVNMGMKQKNPLQFVSFYRVGNGTAWLVEKTLQEISFMMPERVQAKTVRIFVRSDEKFEAAKIAFKQYCKQELGEDCVADRGFSHTENQNLMQSQSAALSQRN